MRYDSYSRFLKSQMYKDFIVNELEGKAIKTSKAHGNKSSTLNSNINRRLSSSNLSSGNKLVNAESNNNNEPNKKDKKKGTILPWNKGKYLL
jgi:hypothetical protein